jgi:hypothetical protein
MTGEAWLFLLAVLLNAVNLFLQVFFTIMYSDLEVYAMLLPAISFAAHIGSKTDSTLLRAHHSSVVDTLKQKLTRIILQ